MHLSRFPGQRLRVERGSVAIVRTTRAALRRILFGGGLPPQEFTIGLKPPQSEIAVWLVGSGAPIDITFRHSMACSEPLILALAFENDRTPPPDEGFGLTLEYRRRDFPEQLLGKIHLGPIISTLSTGSVTVMLFETDGSANYCLQPLRKLIYYSLYFHRHATRAKTADVKMSFAEERAAIVTFIRPHPVFLGSVSWETGGNIFPMNLIGELGDHRIAFALKDSRRPAHLVERLGRIAISNLPFSHGQVPYSLANNHKKESIAWDRLPFQTRRSRMFEIPVPDFATRARELEVEKVQPLGSHTLFLARIVSDESYSHAPELCAIHGLYQLWRVANGAGDLRTSIEQDAINKGGVATHEPSAGASR